MLKQEQKWPKIFVVIPIFNGGEQILRCLDNLQRVNYDNLEVVVVDDGSTDGSADKIRARFPQVHLQFGDGNLWWSGGTNRGIELALEQGADYILTLNHDTVFDENFIMELYQEAVKNPKYICGPKVYVLEDLRLVWSAGGGTNWKNLGLYNIGCFQPDDPRYDVVQDVDWFPGMGVLHPAQVFRDAGLFDEKDFPQYFGDAEFSFRAAKHGYINRYVPSAKLWNETGSSGLRTSQRLTLKKIVQSLYHRRSSKNIVSVWRFYSRYCPKHLLPICLGTIYVRFLGSMMKRWAKERMAG